MDERLIAALKMEYVAVFQADILNGRLSNIQKLYDAARITTDMLVRQLNRHTAAMTDLNKAVFNDIAFILAEELVKNEELVSVFDDLYYKQYKEIYDAIEEAGNVIVNNYDRGMKILGNLVRKVLGYSGNGKITPDKMNTITKSNKYRIMCLLNMRNQNLVNSGIIGEDTIRELARNWKQREAGSSELYLNDDKVLFTQEGERVFQSKMYESFIKRQKEALAAYLGVTPDKLATYFDKEMDHDLRTVDFSFLPLPGDAGIASMATINVIESNYGGAQWFHTITSSKGIRKGSVGYRPDLDKLIDSYYRARVMVKYPEIVNSGRDFTKLALSRECKAENIRDDYLSLLYLYNTDIVYQMFKLMMELYYRNFSWENISKQSPLSRSNQIVQELRDVISSKDRKIADLNRRIAVMNSANDKIVNSERVTELREQNRLLDIIEQKEQEIADLKEKLRYQDELIDAFNRPDDEFEDITIDLEMLQTKRYLFVGHTEEDFPELNHLLKKTFTDSIFMRSETDNIDRIAVDAVVVFLNWTSHGMYYKLKANSALKAVPMVYCKTKNIDRIYQEIQEGLFR